ncbi:hypothetical protein [Butyrivibrio fibrisolvens]|uniref:hypothetical protein n=1 Tax=Butyrivibrio fibrisolvens TaxID=831 RepID=UPI0003B33F2D|nr:hypothetical protein [Butyrivibrio fibrisolvens]
MKERITNKLCIAFLIFSIILGVVNHIVSINKKDTPVIAEEDLMHYEDTVYQRESKKDKNINPKSYIMYDGEGHPIKAFDIDDDGNILKQYSVGKNDVRQIEYIYSYSNNSSGNPMTMIAKTADSQRVVSKVKAKSSLEKPRFLYSYEYDENGETLYYSLEEFHYDQYGFLLSKETYIDGEGLKCTNNYKCSLEGKIIQDDLYNCEGTLESSTIYEYTEFGEISQKVTYNADGEVTNRAIYKYDSKDYLRKIETYTTFAGNVLLDGYTIYEYDIYEEDSLGKFD